MQAIASSPQQVPMSAVPKGDVRHFRLRERMCADTTGIVPVPWTGDFNAKILMYISNKIYGSNFVKQHSETVIV